MSARRLALLFASALLTLRCASSTPVTDTDDLFGPGGKTEIEEELELQSRASRLRPEVEATIAVSTGIAGDTTLGEWRSIGPRNYGGKVYDVAVDPTNKNIVYAAYCSGGGLWKTTDGGSTWTQVTDNTKGTWTFTRGTGKFKGIKGGGRFTGTISTGKYHFFGKATY